MKKYIDYNNDNGLINCIRIIQESDLILYDTASLLEIDNDLEVDLNNSYISGGMVLQKPDFNVECSNFTYPISSTEYIILSSIPENTLFKIYDRDNDSDIIEMDNINDGLLEINFDTAGIYKVVLDNELFNNITSTYHITAY